MSSIKIIHCSDLHFSAPFAGLNHEQAEQRTQDLWDTFEKIIETAAEEKVNLLLISGDLFEQVNITQEQLKRIRKLFEHIPNTKIFISPGDHDPLTQDTSYRLIVWPENVYIFASQIESFYIPEWDTVIYGCGFTTYQQNSSLLKKFQVQNTNRINIMVLHGEVCSAYQQSVVNPIYIEDIENSNLDYLALGHSHSFSGIQKAGQTTWAYCGTPEAGEFDNYVSKGVIIGVISQESTKLDFREICKRKYLEVYINISAINSKEELIAEIYLQTKSLSPKENLIKVIFEGNLNKTLQINVSELMEKIENDFFYIKLIDESSKVNTLSQNIDFTLEGIFIQKVKEEMLNATQKEKRMLELAFKIGLTAFEQGRGNQ